MNPLDLEYDETSELLALSTDTFSNGLAKLVKAYIEGNKDASAVDTNTMYRGAAGDGDSEDSIIRSYLGN